MVRIINVEPDDEDNKGFLKDSIGKRPIVAAFYMPGCIYCELLKKPWNEFTNMLENKYSGDETIIAFVHKDVADDVSSQVKGNMFIQGYPTIMGIQKGGKFKEFKQERTLTNLMKFYNYICGLVTINKKSKKNNRIKRRGTMKGINKKKRRFNGGSSKNKYDVKFSDMSTASDPSMNKKIRNELNINSKLLKIIQDNKKNHFPPKYIDIDKSKRSVSPLSSPEINNKNSRNIGYTKKRKRSKKSRSNNASKKRRISLKL